MCTYATFPVKRKSCYRKSELQMFLRISGSRIGAPTQYINMASPYKALQKVHETFRQVTQKLWATDPRLGQIVYNISFSWLLALDSVQFIFLLHEGEKNL